MTELIEVMTAAAWNAHATIPWDKIPEAWKPFHRLCMVAALGAYRDHHRPQIDELNRRIEDAKKRELEARERARCIPVSSRTLMEPGA